MRQPGAHDMTAVHDGVVPWWLEPRMVPELPTSWDIITEFRESLRYSLAGAYQGAFLTVGGLLLVALGLPLYGILLLPIAFGLPLWVISEAYLVPRRSRPLLKDYASRFPGLWEWSRVGVAREDRRAARGALLLHVPYFVVLLPTAWILWSAESARVLIVIAVATGLVLTGLQLAVLASRLNSAGLPVRSPRLALARLG